MFYPNFMLTKKGPLAHIWLAAHWDEKVTKAHVFETNIEKSVDSILQPKVKMALRTTGHLLLGVVRIHLRKAKYLIAECNEVFVKIKMAFRPDIIDLREAQREAVTLPEIFYDFDTVSELKDIDLEAQLTLNQSTAEKITMREDYSSLSLVTHDQGFSDMSFDAEPPELLRHGSSMEPFLDQSHILFSDGPCIEIALEQKEKEPVAGTSSTAQPMDIDTPIRDDGFDGHLGQDIISDGLFEGDLFEAGALAPIDASTLKENPSSVGFTKAKRKRKLIVDKVKNIFDKKMKAQLSDTSDIVTKLDLAPPTKRIMHWKKTGGVEKLFDLPGRPIPARALFKNYQRHLTSKSYDHEDFGRLGAEDNMSLEQMRDASKEEASSLEQSVLKKRAGRKRKAAQDDEIHDSVSKKAPPADISHPPAEAVEIPSMITHNLPAETSIQSDIPLPAEPSVSDMSSIMPSAESSEVPPTIEAPLPSSEMSQIAPAEVSSILGTHEEPEVSPAQTQENVAQTSDMPQMEIMSYDQTQPQVSYTGYDEHHPPAHTPDAISERAPATPWNHEDYEFPPSVGPQEEQQVDETYEQFAERVLNKRATHMYHVIKNKLDTKDKLTLSEMAYKNNRKQVAQKFYTLLVLKKFQVLELTQQMPYVDITVTEGPKFGSYGSF